MVRARGCWPFLQLLYQQVFLYLRVELLVLLVVVVVVLVLQPKPIWETLSIRKLMQSAAWHAKTCLSSFLLPVSYRSPR